MSRRFLLALPILRLLSQFEIMWHFTFTLTRKLCFKMPWRRGADSSSFIYAFLALNFFKGVPTEGECKTLQAKVATRLLAYFDAATPPFYIRFLHNEKEEVLLNESSKKAASSMKRRTEVQDEDVPISVNNSIYMPIINTANLFKVPSINGNRIWNHLPVLFMLGIAIFVHTYIYKYLHVYMHTIVDAIYMGATTATAL